MCSRCGSANVRCEAMVNPNTKGFDHFTDEAFYYGWCENCGLGVALTDKREIRNEILEKYHRFKKENACEPHYANCRIVQRDSGQVKDVRIMLSPDTGMADDGIFFYCHTLERRKYSINSLVYWVTYVHNVVYSFYRSMIYCYINSTQRCAGSIVIDIIPTNGADKRKFFPFAPYFPVTNVIKRYFYPYFPAIIGIKGYSFPYFPYLSGIMKIKTALYSLFSRLDWHKTVVFPCLGEIYEGIRSLSWEIPVT